MSRTIDFEVDLACDCCGKLGAYDYMGDAYCPDCTTTDEEGVVIIAEHSHLVDGSGPGLSGGPE